MTEFTRCPHCGGMLANKDTIFAYDGHLFCNVEHAARCIVDSLDDGESTDKTLMRRARALCEDRGEYAQTADIMADEIELYTKHLVGKLTPGQLRIAEILVKRDGSSYIEACNAINEAIYQINECLHDTYDTFEADDIMREVLGLEPDYLFDLLS